MKIKQRTKRLDEAVLEARQEKRGKTPGVDKRFTALKTVATKAASGTGSTASGVMEPTAEQLARINEFTRSPKQANEVVCFPTLSCNDLVDRDDEFFDADTVKAFASLPDPFSPIGKSYMVGHDYKKLPVGRIFDAEAAVEDGVQWLKNWVYIPNTKANESFIENIDFGTYWAVSVGVMIDEVVCSLSWCGDPMFQSMFFGSFCTNGHDKSYFYTEDAEEDAWGYPMPCDEGTPGSEKCLGKMQGARDFYELSQVFLGAQFYAALDTKSPGLGGVVRAAAAKGVPIIGLGADEAKGLPMPHMDERAVHAMRAFGAQFDQDQVLKWTDDNSLVWTYDAAENEVSCLGKAASEDTDAESDSDDEEVDDGTGRSEASESERVAHSADEGLDTEAGGDSAVNDSEGDDTADGRVGSGEVQEGVRPDGSVTPSEAPKEASVSKAAVLKSLRDLRAPSALVTAVTEASDDSLGAALAEVVKFVDGQRTEIVSLTEKAALGEGYINELRAEAIDWYVRANQTEPNKGVNTDLFVKMLDQCGNNAELIKGLTEMQRTTAQAKFPKAVRRSSFPVDANTPDVDPVPDKEAKVSGGKRERGGSTVERIHG